MKIFRDGIQQLFDVTLGSLQNQTQDANYPPERSSGISELGLTVESLNESLITRFGLDDNARGVVVIEVAAGSIAEDAGIQAGDLIVSAKWEGNRLTFAVKPAGHGCEKRSWIAVENQTGWI